MNQEQWDRQCEMFERGRVFDPPTFLDAPLPKIGDYKPVRNPEPTEHQKRLNRLAGAAYRAWRGRFKCEDQELFE